MMRGIEVMKSNIQRILGAGTVLLAIVATVGMATAQSNRTMRIDRSGRLPAQSKAGHHADKQKQQFEPVRLEGELTIRSNELRVGREQILITPSTSVFPAPRDPNRMPDLNRYRGQHAIVFGRRGPNGIEASAVMFRDASTQTGVHGQVPLDLNYRQEVTPRTGALRRDVPQ
jgi:hypothetical protein